MGDEVRDTGDVAEVPEDERLDADAGDESDTGLDETTGDDGDLHDVYDEPGEVVEGELA